VIARHRWELGIFLGALLLRLAWIAVSPAQVASDAMVYDTTGASIASGLGYVGVFGPTAHWPVGYPAFLGAVYLVLGHHVWCVQVLQAAIGALTAVLTYRIGAGLADVQTGRLAGVMLAVSPNQISYPAVLWSEVVFTFVFLSALLLLLWVRRQGRAVWWHGLVGVLLALACYVRPVPLLLAPVIGLLELIRRPGHRLRVVAEYAVLGAAMALTILPWTLRNYRALGAPVLISTNGGSNLYMGNNPLATGRYQQITDPEIQALRADEVGRERLASSKAWAFIRNNPGRVAQLAVRKAFFLFYADWDGIYENFRQTATPVPRLVRYGLYAMCEAYYLVVIGLCLMALLRRDRWHEGHWFLLTVVAYWVAIHLVYVAEPRYHFPVMPLLVVFAAGAGARLLPRRWRVEETVAARV
jgi:4-amino-4-deoxy-L-arabinose transferase-like glycosyltransferase